MLSVEQSCHINDKRWNATKEELFHEYIPHLEAEGIMKEAEVTGVHLLKAAEAYPMYLYGYKDHFERFVNYCDSIEGLHLAGRTGKFRYMDIDQCMKLSFILADEMLKA